MAALCLALRAVWFSLLDRVRGVGERSDRPLWISPGRLLDPPGHRQESRQVSRSWVQPREVDLMLYESVVDTHPKFGAVGIPKAIAGRLLPVRERVSPTRRLPVLLTIRQEPRSRAKGFTGSPTTPRLHLRGGRRGDLGALAEGGAILPGFSRNN